MLLLDAFVGVVEIFTALFMWSMFCTRPRRKREPKAITRHGFWTGVSPDRDADVAAAQYVNSAEAPQRRCNPKHDLRPCHCTLVISTEHQPQTKGNLNE